MTIVCGTDFSQQAAHAVDVAAALSAALGQELKIIYAFDKKSSEQILASAEEVVLATIRSRLRNEVERVRGIATDVEGEILTGAPDEALVEMAERIGASLLVVSATGSRSASFWTLGSVAERTARTAPCPTLVVRDPQPLVQWSREDRPLKIVVGIDSSPASDSGVSWVRELRKSGPCEVTFAHIYSPVEEASRLGLPTIPIAAPGSELETILSRELSERLQRLGEDDPHIELQMNLGRSADPLVILAEDHGADLLVVGSNRRSGIERARHGSVSYTALHLASMSVVSVPIQESARQERQPRALRYVVAAVGSMEEAAPIAGHGASLLAGGGTLHVVVAAEAGERGVVQQRIESQAEDALGGHTLRVERAAGDLAEAAARIAEEVDADVICASLREGERLLRVTRRPVLLVRGPGES